MGWSIAAFRAFEAALLKRSVALLDPVHAAAFLICRLAICRLAIGRLAIADWHPAKCPSFVSHGNLELLVEPFNEPLAGFDATLALPSRFAEVPHSHE